MSLARSASWLLWYAVGVFATIVLSGSFLPESLALAAVPHGTAWAWILGGALLTLVLSFIAGRSDLRRTRPNELPGGRPVPESGPLQRERRSAGLAVLLGVAVAAAAPNVDVATEPVTEVEDARGGLVELVIDGNRNGHAVTMRHDHARAFLCDESESCVRCHHMQLPGDRFTTCATCHTHMEAPTDVFVHDQHAAALGGNDSCVICHADPDVEPLRENTPECGSCHDVDGDAKPAHRAVMQPVGSKIGMGKGLAVSYRDAFHESCMKCHAEVRQDLAQCSQCHTRPATPEGDS